MGIVVSPQCFEACCIKPPACTTFHAHAIRNFSVAEMGGLDPCASNRISMPKILSAVRANYHFYQLYALLSNLFQKPLALLPVPLVCTLNDIPGKILHLYDEIPALKGLHLSCDTASLSVIKSISLESSKQIQE